MKALFICKKRTDNYGKSFGLINSARFVSEFLNSIGHESKVITVIDSNDIDREVTTYNPDYVFIEAIWVTPAKFKELLSIQRHKPRKWVVRIHSKFPFLANEGIAFKYLNEYYKIRGLFVAPNSFETFRDLDKLYQDNTLYLPNVYFNEHQIKKVNQCKSEIDIASFGAIRPFKNTLIQAIAAIRYARNLDKELKFHINADRLEQNGDSVLKNLIALFDNTKHQLVFHPWYNYLDFLNKLSTMDIVMQVSFSETFNIVAADTVKIGVPLVTSKEVEWAGCLSKANPNSSDSIVNKLNLVTGVLKYPSILLNQITLENYNTKAKTQWLNTIK